jgi:y4mF family transcriptional regulator
VQDSGRPGEYIMKTIQDMQSLGQAIRDRRRELGYTQAFLASYAGVSASFLSELENGKETVQINKMMDVLSLLGMDIYVVRRGE